MRDPRGDAAGLLLRATGAAEPARRLRRCGGGDGADARFGAPSVAPCRQCQVVRQADATKVRELVMPSITRRGAIEGWIIDDTSRRAGTR
jgi:hypothetical protein